MTSAKREAVTPSAKREDVMRARSARPLCTSTAQEHEYSRSSRQRAEALTASRSPNSEQKPPYSRSPLRVEAPLYHLYRLACAEFNHDDGSVRNGPLVAQTYPNFHRCERSLYSPGKRPPAWRAAGALLADLHANPLIDAGRLPILATS